jgi:hypothetical protein
MIIEVEDGKLDDRVKKYLEYELKSYTKNKRKLEELENDIILSSPSPEPRNAT